MDDSFFISLVCGIILAFVGAVIFVIWRHHYLKHLPTEKRIRYIEKMDKEKKQLDEEFRTAATGTMAGLMLSNLLDKKDKKKDGDKPWYA